MELCLQPDAMQLFLSMLDPAIVALGDKQITVNATEGPVVYQWVEWLQRFCIDGIADTKMGEPV